MKSKSEDKRKSRWRNEEVRKQRMMKCGRQSIDITGMNKVTEMR